jgi:hypothetical protein
MLFLKRDRYGGDMEEIASRKRVRRRLLVLTILSVALVAYVVLFLLYAYYVLLDSASTKDPLLLIRIDHWILWIRDHLLTMISAPFSPQKYAEIHHG